MDTSVNPNDPESQSQAEGPRPSVAAVRRMLEGVMDPELHANIVELGMVRDIEITTEGLVTIEVALTTAGCPLRVQIRKDVESKVHGLAGVTDVKVRYGEMTADEKREVMNRARWNARERAPDTEIPSTTRVLAIASGKGGVGKSSVTANLAVALAAQGRTVGVIDADIWGFSIPRMMGVDGRLGGHDGLIDPHEIDVPNTNDPSGARGVVKVVSMGFLVDDESTALMWRGLILARALEQFLTDVRWGPMDYLLVDMPPGTGDIQMALLRLLPRTELLVVTTPALAAQKVAVRVADMARRSFAKVLGVVENMSEFIAPDGQAHAIFGSGGGAALAREIGAPLLAKIPIEPDVSIGGDTGKPSVLSHPDSPASAAFRLIADRIASDLLPPVEMAGCTAHMLALMESAAEVSSASTTS